jgi:hypothetical protein
MSPTNPFKPLLITGNAMRMNRKPVAMEPQDPNRMSGYAIQNMQRADKARQKMEANLARERDFGAAEEQARAQARAQEAAMDEKRRINRRKRGIPGANYNPNF